MPPSQCDALVEAWKDREKRTDRRIAAMQLTIAQSQGVKINGRNPMINDFLPTYAKESPDARLMAMAAKGLAEQERKKRNG